MRHLCLVSFVIVFVALDPAFGQIHSNLEESSPKDPPKVREILNKPNEVDFFIGLITPYYVIKGSGFDGESVVEVGNYDFFVPSMRTDFAFGSSFGLLFQSREGGDGPFYSVAFELSYYKSYGKYTWSGIEDDALIENISLEMWVAAPVKIGILRPMAGVGVAYATFLLRDGVIDLAGELHDVRYAAFDTHFFFGTNVHMWNYLWFNTRATLRVLHAPSLQARGEFHFIEGDLTPIWFDFTFSMYWAFKIG